jgi:arginine decarboxylase
VVIHTLDPKGVPHPDIITESGRATIAYSSVLLFNVLDVANFEPSNVPAKIPEEEHQLVHHLVEALNIASPQKLQECYNDAVFYRDEIRELFKRGQISLRSRSLAENLFLQVMQKLLTLSPEAPRDLKELEKLKEQLSDIYYCNFSLFQSLPDIWAIDQIFPVAPIHRLNERPERQAIIADITCDCDGKIDRFSSPEGMNRTLPLHAFKEDEEYYIGVFLVGAYQETLGDLHNLFGDTNVVSVRFNEDGTYDFADEIEGDSIADVLSYVEYQPHILKERFRKIAERSVRDGKISGTERQEIMKSFSESMQGYTYYEKE